VIASSLFSTNKKTDRDDDIAGKDNANGDDHGNNITTAIMTIITIMTTTDPSDNGSGNTEGVAKRI